MSRRVLCIALLLTALAGTAPISASASWTSGGSGTRAYAEARSQSPGSRLRLSCEEAVTLYLYPPRSWDGTRLDPTYLTIGGQRTTVFVDPVDRGVILSDRPNNAVGITASLLARLKTGRTLVISSPAAARIPPAQLTFSLENAAAAIARLERGCPAASGS